LPKDNQKQAWSPLLCVMLLLDQNWAFMYCAMSFCWKKVFMLLYCASLVELKSFVFLCYVLHSCCNPTFGRMGGWHSHSRNGDLGVRQDSQNFKVQLQGLKHLALKRSLYHWKVIEV
jgi:hypothetical protein